MPEFSANYLQYKRLKKLIKQAQQDVRSGNSIARADLTHILYELDRNVEDVHAFFTTRLAEYMRVVDALDRRYHLAHSTFDHASIRALEMDEWEDLLSSMLELRSMLQKIAVCVPPFSFPGR